MGNENKTSLGIGEFGFQSTQSWVGKLIILSSATCDFAIRRDKTETPFEEG